MAKWFNKLQSTPNHFDDVNSSFSPSSHEEAETNGEPLSLPSATDFINRIIHSEVINGEDTDLVPSNNNDSQSDDILVLNTQPEDYSGLDIPDSEFSVPETSDAGISIS